MHTAKALTRLCIYRDSTEPSNFVHAIIFTTETPRSVLNKIKPERTAFRYNGTAHEILVPIATASSEGSDESAHVCNLSRAFVVLIHKVCISMKAQANI